VTYHPCDEVTVGGPGTCAFMQRDVPHAWKNVGSETGRVLFLYTPAASGGLIEAMAEGRPIDKEEWPKLYERHRWEMVGAILFEIGLRAEAKQRREACADSRSRRYCDSKVACDDEPKLSRRPKQRSIQLQPYPHCVGRPPSHPETQ
jgi:hypothetical protein